MPTIISLICSGRSCVINQIIVIDSLLHSLVTTLFRQLKVLVALSLLMGLNIFLIQYTIEYNASSQLVFMIKYTRTTTLLVLLISTRNVINVYN